MNQKILSKVFAGVAVFGVGMTTYLAVKATPGAMEAIKESGAKTRKEKLKVAFKHYIPTMASGVITITSIIANHSTLAKENAKVAFAYGIGQTALRIYSEHMTPQVRQEANQQVFEQVNTTQDVVFLDPTSVPDNISVNFIDYLSNRECYLSRKQITEALNEFEESYLKINGKGSLNQLYSCFHGTAIENPIGYFGEIHGWIYKDCQGPIPLISPGFNKQGLPCAVLDYVNPPQNNYNDEFA